MGKLTIKDLDLRGKRVFMRVDFNVPLKDGVVTDDTRIRETIPTLKLAIEKGGRLVLASHLGRPKSGPEPKYSVQPAAKKLEELLGRPVAFALDCVGPGVESQSKALVDGEVLVLENVRFHPEEEKNDEAFSKQLAALCDGLFVCDAFGSAHRAHASVVGITRFVQLAAAGLLMEKELAYLGKAVSNPARPLVAILGGAKVSDKIGVIQHLLTKVDALIIGGGMAFTFLKAKGTEIGNSLVENDMLDFAKGIEDHALSRGVKFYLPVDCVVAASREPGAESKIVPVQEIPKEWYGLDIGPASVKLFNEAVQNAKTILWNGPMGVFEIDAYARGTLAMAHAIADAYALTIVGGGETALAVHRAGESENMSFISTGGGAALELLEGKQLPGLTALPDRVA